MATIEQIRAARALLDWSQSDLADHAGLSQTGIARIENGTNKPNSQTINKIMTAFTSENIEFIDNGVRTSPDKLLVLKGEDSLRKLQDDIFHTVNKEKDCIRILGIEEIAVHEEKDYEYTSMQIKRLMDLGIREKILVKQGASSFLAPRQWYRSIDDKYFAPHSIYIYGTKIALNLRNPQYKSLILDNAFFSETMKNFFDALWDNAKQA